jgi:TolA-binding protein
MNLGKSRTHMHGAWALAAGLAAISATGASSTVQAQDATMTARQTMPGASSNTVPTDQAVPAATPMTDLLTRMDALEARVAQLTAQNEEMANRQRQFEAKLSTGGSGADPATAAATSQPTNLTPVTPAASVPTPVPAAVVAKSATATNLSAMTGGASGRPDAARPTGPARPTAQRLAAVKAVIKPQSGNAGLDEYSYGFRLYTEKFYPEAAQQLKLYIDKYPKDDHISHARNLLGRAYLDDGKPRDAAPWFLNNYKSDPQGPRAADSLLNLAEAMHQLGDSNRACIALNEFSTTYAAEAKGRLRADYTKTRGALTCS